MSEVAGAHPSPAKAAPFPWQTAVALCALTAVLYGLLPGVAPTTLAGSSDILLLGVVLGIVVGINVRVDGRIAPLVALVGAVAVGGRFLLVGDDPRVVVPIAIVIGLDLWAMTYLIRRSHAQRLARPQDVLLLLGIAIAVGLIAGLLAATVTQAGGEPFGEFVHSTRAWLVDDVFGLLCVAPAFMTITRPRDWPGSRAPEFIVASVFSAAVTYAIFQVVTPGNEGLFGWPYLVILGPLWIAVRLGVRAVAPVIAVVAWTLAVSTVDGHGAFSGASKSSMDQLITAELFAIVIAGTVLLLGVLRDDRLRSLVRARESARLLREIVDGSDALVFAKSYEESADSGRYVLVNKAWTRALGLPPEQTIGRSDRELFAPNRAAVFAENDSKVMRTGQGMSVEEVDYGPAGQVRHYSSSKFPLFTSEGKLWGVGGIATDISALVHARERERRTADLLRAVFELSPTPAMRLSLGADDSVTVLDTNMALALLLGAAPADVESMDHLARVHQEDRAAALDVLTASRKRGTVRKSPTARQRELRLTALDGRLLWVLMSAAAVGPVDANGALELVAQFEDFTARRMAEEALSDQALRDAVTGLPNRRALTDRIGSALQRLRRNPGLVAVLFCDLDRFKDVNDSMGHQVGDQMLVEVADRLKTGLRPQDTVARLGGDEFVALGEGLTDAGGAVQMASRLMERLGAAWTHGDQTFRPSMSVGIALTDDPDIGVDELLRRADLAMYRAKDAGRNRVEIYDKSVDADIQEAVAVQHDLRRAIDKGELVLHYQPIVTLRDRRVVGAEALVRMPGRDGRLRPPGEFVPQAETSGLIVPMGAWVIRQALTELRTWRDLGRELSMSVNVSPAQLREEGFAAFIMDQVHFADVDPSWLSIEVTETALLHDPGRSARELAALSRAGIGISLDDFGTGYSSLSWLTQFPVNVVKIDRSFTDELGIDERKSAIVSALIQVSHELGFSVVAEGVETELQCERLLTLGCDRGQGFLFGRPVAPSDADWMAGEPA